MKKFLFLLLFLVVTGTAVLAQSTITLTFTGRDQNNAYVRLDNVTIQNLTRGWTEAIFFPDTVYTLTIGTGISDYADGNEMQVMPNPFDGRTQLNLCLAQGESVRMVIVDITGKKCAEYSGRLSEGDNIFEIMLTTPQTYILSVQTSEGMHSVKMVNTGRAGANKISLVGGESNTTKVKISSTKSHVFELGDEMRYTGYSQQSNGLVSSIPVTQQQYEGEAITLNFDLSSDAELPVLATVAASNISSNSATSGGNIFSDGGATVTARGVCWSVVHNPTLAESHTNDGIGTGAFTSNLTNLVENTTYYIRAYATNSAGTAYGQEVSFTTQTGSSTGQSCPGTPTVTDYDGNVYNTVQIGDQCWMKENLRATHYANGEAIPLGNGVPSETNPYRNIPDNNANNVPTYGYLYNWIAVMHGDTSANANPSGVQGVCPNGWHVPSDAEWTQLANYVNSQNEFLCGGYNNYIAKALASNSGWNNHDVDNACAICNNLSLNNATGFSAYPAGMYGEEPYGFGNYTGFWSTTSYDDYSESKIRLFYYYEAELLNTGYSWETCLSVRCVRGEGTSVQIPTVITSDVSAYTNSTAVCGGDVIFSGDAPVTARGLCWRTSPNPTVADNHTTDGSGLGSFTTTLTGLSDITTYYVRAFATNSYGTAYGEERVFVTTNPNDGHACTDNTQVVDYDGNTYNTVQIGSQCWMKENLRTTHYADGGEMINSASVSGYSYNDNDPYYFYPNGDMTLVGNYGLLYNWKATMRNSNASGSNPSCVQGVCPVGWHIPSNPEWMQLRDYVRTRDEYVCGNNNQPYPIANALADTMGWSSSAACAPGNITNTTNITGFSARPAGTCEGNHTWSYYHYNDFGSDAYFWTTTTTTSGGSQSWNLSSNSPSFPGETWSSNGWGGRSVRCVRDEENPVATVPTVTTDSVWKNTDAVVSCLCSVTSGGGATVTERGICWSTFPNPTTADNKETSLDGLGNYIAFAGGLISDTTYYLRAYATNSAGTGYGNVLVFTATRSTGVPCDSMSYIIDIDGNMYNTVKIGNQCWMKENLRVRHYPNGNIISQLTHNDNASVYGELYTWAQMMGYAQHSGSNTNQSGVQGICPDGWHIPSAAEWSELATYSGSHYACSYNNNTYIAKALAAKSGWVSSSTSNSCNLGSQYGSWNATGFSAIPNINIAYAINGSYPGAFFWSTTSINQNSATTFGLRNDYAQHINATIDINNRLSVRCVHNLMRSPVVTTTEVLDFSDTSVILGGVVDFDNYDSVTVRGIIWSDMPIYTGTNGYPYLPSGAGNNVVIDSGGIGSFTTTINNLSPNTKYYFFAYAINSKGIGYGQIMNFQTACAGIPVVTDFEGNVYHTVKIGNQCWTRENLRSTRYFDGGVIYHKMYIYDANDTIAGLFYPDDSLGCVGTYGYLYNWKAAMRNEPGSNYNPGRVQGVCPDGWHLPSQLEMSEMISYVASQSEYYCSNSSTNIARALAAKNVWHSSSTNCALGNNPTNATGFSALPAGHAYYYSSGTYYWEHTKYSQLGYYAYFLCSTESGNNFYQLYLYQGSAAANLTTSQKSSAVSVRCIHNEVQLSEITTDDVSAITDNSAVCGGSVGWEGFAPVTERGVCWSTIPNPTIGDNRTTDGSGTGSFTSNITGLTAGTTYYVRAYATNSAGTAYGEEKTFTTPNSNDGQPCTGAATLTDRDGNTYSTVQIGRQCWMKENLRTTKFADGTYIPLGSSTSSSPCRYNPGNSANNVSSYGYLYNGYAMMYGDSCSSTNPSEVQGVCPNEWHVPSMAEWTQLADYVSSQSNYWCGSNPEAIAKALASTTGWTNVTSNSYSCIPGKYSYSNNATGFSMNPAGNYSYSNSNAYYGLGTYADFWSVSGTSTYHYFFRIGHTYAYIFYNYSAGNTSALTVRCLRNTGITGGTTTSIPVVTTSAVTNITQNSATLNGSISNPDNVPIIAQGFSWRSDTTTYQTVNATGNTMSYNLTGLIANTTYYFRAFATTADSTVYGDEVSFTTLQVVNHCYLLSESFDANIIPIGWMTIDSDGDGKNWAHSSSTYMTIPGYDGSGGCVMSESWDSVALYPNNWLITSAVTLPNNPASLSYWVGSYNMWPSEHYGVYITTSSDYTNLNNYTLLFEETLDGTGVIQNSNAWKQKTVSLNTYAGDTVHLAFRHFNVTDIAYILLDEIMIFYDCDTTVGTP